MHTVSLTHQLVTIQDDFDLDKIIESGQCFRPQKLPDGRYRFLSGGALLYLVLQRSFRLAASYGCFYLLLALLPVLFCFTRFVQKRMLCNQLKTGRR